MATINRLAYEKDCEGCGDAIYMVICRDGRWRPFEKRRVLPAEHGVWAWRKKHGMEEQQLTPGHLVHICPAYHDRAFWFADNVIGGER